MLYSKKTAVVALQVILSCVKTTRPASSDKCTRVECGYPTIDDHSDAISLNGGITGDRVSAMQKGRRGA